MAMSALARIGTATQELSRQTLTSLRSYVGALRYTQSFILETQGTDFVLWCKSQAQTASSQERAPIQSLSEDCLKQSLSSIGYIGQPLAVILHPPCVCYKIYEPKDESPEKWLARNLEELCPPVSRRELTTSFSVSDSGRIEVAFIRTSFLDRMITLLLSCGVSIDGIHVGGQIASTRLESTPPGSAHQDVISALCSYIVANGGNSLAVTPKVVDIGSEGSETGGKLIELHQQARVSRTRMPDFRTQAKLPMPRSLVSLKRIIRSELMLAAVVMIGLLFHLGAKWLIGVNGSDPEYIAAISLLEKLRSANEHSSKAVDVAKNATRPKFVLCRLLKSIAQSTPQTLVLSSIGIASSTTKTEFEFSLQGYGLNSSSSLSFIDSLRGEAGVLEINLTKGTTVENRFASLGANFKSKSLIKFEVIGKYAVN